MELETEVQQLKKKIRDHDQSVLKVTILYKLRMMAFQNKCQRMVHEALTDMNAMEKRKWEVQEETRLERDLLQQQLAVRALCACALPACPSPYAFSPFVVSTSCLLGVLVQALSWQGVGLHL